MTMDAEALSQTDISEPRIIIVTVDTTSTVVEISTMIAIRFPVIPISSGAVLLKKRIVTAAEKNTMATTVNTPFFTRS